MSSTIDDSTVARLQANLDRLSTSASVVVSNLANVDTPGYRALRANFPEALSRLGRLKLERTDRSHAGTDGFESRIEPILTEAPLTRLRMDGNSVDIDKEMTALASIQGRFTASARMIQRRFALLLYAVSDGRR